jgi:FlgN protein
VSGYAEVSETLWRERELLDLLLFKLDSQRLLLRAGSIRWLARSTHEVDLVLEQLQLVEINRALEVDNLAAQLGLPPGATLSDVAEVAPTPWTELLHAHRAAFRTLIDEVTALAEANQRALRDACSISRRNLTALQTATFQVHV